jgi:transposase
MSDGSQQLDLGIFNEAEALSNAEEAESITETTKTTRRRKRSGKRQELFDNLPKGEPVIYEIPEEERICPICGGPLHVCGHDVVRKEVQVIPVQFYVVEHIQEVYGCRNCEKTASDTSVPVVKPPMSPPLLPKSGIASSSLLAYIICNKYLLALPLYRQEQEFNRFGLDISRQTMANWLMFVANLLLPLYKLLYKAFLLETSAHADETTTQVIHENGRKASQKSYMWVYITGLYAAHRIVLFEYRPTRKGEYPLEFLSGFKGYLHTDAYAGYRKLELNGIILVGCWAHLRRKFDEALKVLPKEERAASPAAIGLAYCNQLFALEQKYKEENLTPEERYVKRLLKSKPVAEAFFEWVKTVVYAKKSKLGIAVVYSINQKERLLNFLLDGRLEISNNIAENAIRPFAIGRKNWLFSYCTDGAKASAILYSIIETAHANGLMPYLYLKFLLDTLPNITEGQIGDCLPWNTTVKEICKIPTST